jgi:hypothetical protein
MLAPRSLVGLLLVPLAVDGLRPCVTPHASSVRNALTSGNHVAAKGASIGRRAAMGLALTLPQSAMAILPLCEDGVKKSGCRLPYQFT